MLTPLRHPARISGPKPEGPSRSGKGAFWLVALLFASEGARVVVADVARALRVSGVVASWKDEGFSAKDLAENLFATSEGIKHQVTTPAGYRERMRIAVKMVCSRTVGA